MQPAPSPHHRPTVAVLGLGLIGASAAAALRHSGHYARVIGYDVDAAQTAHALRNGHISHKATSLATAVAGAEVVLLCMYVGGILNALAQLGPLLQPGALVLDVGSSKAAVVQAMDSLPRSIDAVGGHPMTGKRSANSESPTPHLFAQRVFVLTPGRHTTPRAMQRARQLVAHLGAKPLELDPDTHDRLVAQVSHLLPLLPLALLHSALNAGDDAVWQLAAGGFRQATEGAQADLGFWLDVFASNPDGLAAALRGLAAELASLATLLEGGDMDALRDYAQTAKSAWVRRYGDA